MAALIELSIGHDCQGKHVEFPLHFLVNCEKNHVPILFLLFLFYFEKSIIACITFLSFMLIIFKDKLWEF